MSENSSFYGGNPTPTQVANLQALVTQADTDAANAAASATAAQTSANNAAATLAGAALKGANADITSLSALTTPLSVAQGGTGDATLAAHGVLVGNGTSGIAVTSAGTAGQLLTSNGASADPTFQTPIFNYPPSGHLTLTSGVPILTGAVSAAATVYYTPHCGNTIPVWNGTSFVPTSFAELSNVLAQSSTGKAGPAAAVASSVYDFYVWNDSGTLRLTRSPAWISTTSRGTGVGTAEQTRVNGYTVNNQAITNGPAAGFGTYVGTGATDSSGGTITYSFGGIGAGGVAGNLNLWNKFNRTNVAAMSQDNTSSWTYAVATWRAANNSTGNRINFVVGAVEDSLDAEYTSYANTSGTGVPFVGIGLNATTAFSGITGRQFSTTASEIIAKFSGFPSLGVNFVSAIETPDSANIVSFFGTNSQPTRWQGGLTFSTRM